MNVEPATSQLQIRYTLPLTELYQYYLCGQNINPICPHCSNAKLSTEDHDAHIKRTAERHGYHRHVSKLSYIINVLGAPPSITLRSYFSVLTLFVGPSDV